MKLLVTGGAGFIGSALIRRLIRETDTRVVNVDILTYAGNPAALEAAADSPRHTLERVDVRDGAALGALFRRHRPDAVVHLAAESHVDRSIAGPEAFVQTNVLGSFTLLEAARVYWERLEAPRRDAFRFLHVSTDEVFGCAEEGGAFREHSPYRPNSPYSASKAAADHFARAWWRTYGLPVVVTHCANNYGPWQHVEKLIPLAISRALRGEPIPVYGDGLQRREWLYVDDHCRGLLAALEAGEPGRHYLFGGRAERTNREVVETLCGILDTDHPRHDGKPYREQIRPVPDRPGHDRRYLLAADETERALGWRPELAFEEGLRRTVRWYLARAKADGAASKSNGGGRIRAG